MNRNALFALGIVAGVVCLIVAVLYWTGHSWPSGVHIKHGLLFLALAVIAFIFAAVNRPVGTTA
jgi:uncharacterized membrane protein YccC